MTIRIDVPPNTNTVTVDFDTLLENTISDHQLLLAWNTAVLYPRGIDKRELLIEPSIDLPPHWQQGSSLTVTNQVAGRVTFAATSLERLIDSPVLAGEFFRAVPLASKWPAELDLMGQLAGFELESRHADWSGAEFTAESPSHVSVYRHRSPTG